MTWHLVSKWNGEIKINHEHPFLKHAWCLISDIYIYMT